MELSLCPRVPQRWESPPPGQSRRSSLATLPLLWGMEGAIEQRELCVISWRSSDHEPLMSSLCAQISFRESQSRSWRETIEMFQHPIYPTAVALDPFFFFFSLATVSQPEPNQSQPGCPAGGIDELCRSGPASTVPFSPALARSFVSLSFADPSVFFLATSSSDLDSDSPIPAQRPTTADPEIPTGQPEAPSIFWTSIASRTSPPTRSKLLHLLCRRKVLSPIANPSSQPKPFQHVTRAVTTAYDSRV